MDCANAQSNSRFLALKLIMNWMIQRVYNYWLDSFHVSSANSKFTSNSRSNLLKISAVKLLSLAKQNECLIFLSLCPLSHSIVLARLRLWYHQLPGYRYQFVPHSTWPSNSSWDRHVDLVGKNFQKKKTFYSEAPESRSCHMRWWSCKESFMIYLLQRNACKY